LLKLSSIILFALLSLSSFSNFDIYGTSENIVYEKQTIQTDQNYSENNIFNQSSKSFTINFVEHVLISSDNFKDKEKFFNDANKNIKPTVAHQLSLLDKVQISSSDSANDEFLTLIKHNDNRHTILDRIFNSDRKNLNKLSFVQNLLEHNKLSVNYISDVNLAESLQIFIFKSDLKIDLLFNIFEHDYASSIESLKIEIPFNQNDVNSLQNNLNDPTIVYLLIPFAGIVLLYSENLRLKSLKNSNIRALPLLIILIASLGVTPLSISSSYWGPQFAYADNSTNDVIEQLTNQTESVMSSNITIPTFDATNSKIITAPTESKPKNDALAVTDQISFIVQRAADTLFLDSISMDALAVTDQISFILNGLILETSDAISTSIVPDSDSNTDALAVTDQISFILNGLILETSIPAQLDAPFTNTDALAVTDQIIFVITHKIPGAVFSLTYSPSQTNSTQNDLNQTSTDTLNLDGTDDFIQISNLTSIDTVSDLTITGWVSPDYSQGSSEFTIISKENLFKLSINNNITPEKIAKFSIFDGVKWTDAKSITTIDDKWTHLGATFNGTTIQLYVNGNLSSTTELSGLLTLDINGKLIPTDIDEISSDEDIVVGASINSKKEFDKISNQFSGQIDDISLYDLQLRDDQIKYLYEENQNYYDELNPEEFDLDAVLDEILKEFSNSTDTSLVDSIFITDQIITRVIPFASTTKIIPTNVIVINSTNGTNIVATESILITDSISFIPSQFGDNPAIDSSTPEILGQDVNITPKILTNFTDFKIDQDIEFEFEFVDLHKLFQQKQTLHKLFQQKQTLHKLFLQITLMYYLHQTIHQHIQTFLDLFLD
jgi:hypothetical protein